jgi:hypothetical protein
MNALIVFGGAGGVVAIVAAVVAVGRGVFRQVGATEDNTTALRALTAELQQVKSTLTGHETRIAILEDRIHRS